MFMENNQSIMIVKSEGKEAPYAQMLFQLISKLSNFESSQPITESEYKSSFATIDNTPNEKIIFFGNGKETKIYSKSVNWQYDCFGMKYGWLGKRCVIIADPDEVSLKKQSAFADYYNSRIEQFKSIMDLSRIFYSETETLMSIPEADEIRWCTDELADKVAKKIMWPAIKLMKGVKGLVDTCENARAIYERTELWKRQYELLVCEFIINGLVRFVNNMNDKLIKDKTIIVYDVKDAEYAHLLHNLIQQYSAYDVAEYTEKMFIDNAKSLSSRNKIIFLGKTKSAKERFLDVKYIFDEYGMRFGWRGNHAFINVEKLKSDLREGFITMYSQKSKEFEDKAKDYEKREDGRMGRNGAIIANVAGVLSTPGLLVPGLILFGLPGLVLGAGIAYGVGAGIDQKINSANTVADLYGYQYQLLLREFVFHGLSNFMEA